MAESLLEIQKHVCWRDNLRPEYDVKKPNSRLSRLQYLHKPNRMPSRVVQGKWRLVKPNNYAVTYKPQTIEERFADLAKHWKNETKGLSFAASKINNNNYLAIIGMGVSHREKIIKLILDDLKLSPSYWHYALRKITGDNPVPKTEMSNIESTSKRWLNWGSENGII